MHFYFLFIKEILLSLISKLKFNFLFKIRVNFMKNLKTMKNIKIILILRY